MCASERESSRGDARRAPARAEGRTSGSREYGLAWAPEGRGKGETNKDKERAPEMGATVAPIGSSGAGFELQGFYADAPVAPQSPCCLPYTLYWFVLKLQNSIGPVPVVHSHQTGHLSQHRHQSVKTRRHTSMPPAKVQGPKLRARALNPCSATTSEGTRRRRDPLPTRASRTSRRGPRAPRRAWRAARRLRCRRARRAPALRRPAPPRPRLAE